MSNQSGRIEINAEDYLGHQKKKLEIADRRPVIRRASDLVGPGIAAAAIRITDFNDLLATYNGYFAADAGAVNAPTADQAYVGITTMDAALGGAQVFYGLTDAGVYRRVFTRNPADASAVYWGAWLADVDTDDADWITPTLLGTWGNYGAGFSPARYRRRNDVTYIEGLVAAGTGTIFTLPVGYRPAYALIFAVDTSTGHGRVDVFANGNVALVSGGAGYVPLNFTFIAEQ